MKKAFTLVELLAAIIIIGVISVIVIPKVIDMISSSKEEMYNNQVKKIKNAAKLDVAKNSYDIDFADDVAYITLNSLVEKGYLKSPVKNPKTGNNFDLNNTFVKITKNDNAYSFDVTFSGPNIADSSNANTPEITSNMIPVYYDEDLDVWKKADVNNFQGVYEWYNYTNKKWANAVTVIESKRTTYQNAELGKTINMNDILTFMVWIPRYSYYISSGEINIRFDSISTTATGNATSTYKTHPAFTFYDSIYGFWVSKFEITGSIDNIKSKPNETPILDQKIGAYYTSINDMSDEENVYGYMKSEITGDRTIYTNMIMNHQWGAIAYLSYSEYGFNQEVWLNNNYLKSTGCAGNSASSGQYIGCQNKYNTENGMKSSTTGNIYGVYDMAGGTIEYVMANFNNYIGNSGISTEYTAPKSYLYNLYTTITASTACSGICYGHALSETAGWNGDSSSNFVNSSEPWLTRGGYYNSGTSGGIFNFSRTIDGGSSQTSTRITQLIGPIIFSTPVETWFEGPSGS